jgi:DNA-directed RNA polymerase subunit RPC12/RpoP
MSGFDTYTCTECGEAFRAHPSANAAANEYCSPRCAEAGDGLA